MPITERERIVAVEMCRADGLDPYETIRVQMTGSNPIHLVQGDVARWQVYLREARMLIAGMRGLTLDAN